MKNCFLFCVFFFYYAILVAQVERVDYRSPLDIELIVNGTFGELRNNHFHSGIDFSTNKKIGFPVYAVTDGVINRIKVSPYGYGNVLYLRHSDGYTSVYAHLDSFEETIDSFVKKEQYAQQKSEIELFPLQGELPIKRGQIIGYTGNTGSSGGPHLHFELRNTTTEEIINPYVLGMFSDIKDTQKPVLNGVWVYPANEQTRVQGVAKPIPIDYKRMANGEYLAEKIYCNGAIGFGVNSYDVIEKSFGKNGVYEIKLKVNGREYAHILFDKFSFENTRYINHFIDFKKYKEEGQRIQKIFNKNKLPVPIFSSLYNEGFLEVAANEDYFVVIEISDFHNNKQIINIPVSYRSYPDVEKNKQEGIFVDYYRDYAFEEENLYVEWKAGTFYQDFLMPIKMSDNQIYLGKDIEPVHENIDLRINVEKMQINKEKAFIARIDNEKIIYNDTWKRENDFRIRTKNLGTYRIEVDEEPPTVKYLSKDNLTMKEELLFEIQDNLSGIQSYSGAINGKWARFSYDYKTKTLKHPLSDNIAQKGENIIVLEIKDKIGNNITFEKTFTIY